VRSWFETHQEAGNVGAAPLTCADRLGAESQTVHIYGCRAEGQSDPCGKLNLNRPVAARTGGSTFLVVSSAEEAVFINAWPSIQNQACLSRAQWTGPSRMLA
jgi:hypothetical protein